MIVSYLLDLLFPPKCIICSSYDTYSHVCNKCWSKLSFISSPCCKICSFPFEFEDEQEVICGHCIADVPLYNKSISLFRYDEYSKKLIQQFKYKDQLHILNYLVNLLANVGKELIEQADIIIPVAMYKYKLLKRGYNQSALLAMKIASMYNNLDYIPEMLVKRKNTISQSGLNRKQRSKNIRSSFALNPELQNRVKGKRILLIDDVITTGATINECCKVLCSADPSKIFVLTLAKRIYNR
jgi:ComF family protein